MEKEDIKDAIDKGAVILDVRTEEEYNEGHYEGTLHIPVEELRERYTELDKKKVYVIYCRSGHRSGQARVFLEINGYKAINGGGLNDMYELANK